MQSYEGLIECNPPLTKEEVTFLNLWQSKLDEIYNLSQGKDKKELSKLDFFLNLNLNEGQRWTICTWGYSPMIKWSEKGMEVSGTHKKGNFRAAVLCYLHLLLGENPVIKDAKYKELSFLNEHKFNGIIESEKNDTKWLYIIENNDFFSAEADSIHDYLANPELFEKTSKDDNCQDKLDKYFPPLYSYAKIAKLVHSKAPPEKENKRIKI